MTQGRRTRHGWHGFSSNHAQTFIWYCTSAILIKHVLVGRPNAQLANYHVYTLGMATGYLDPHPRRTLSALEIYNFPRHEFSQNTIVSRSFQTSWFSNLQFSYVDRRYTCIHVQLGTYTQVSYGCTTSKLLPTALFVPASHLNDE